jgi:long-chain acyl-CoA synthetase
MESRPWLKNYPARWDLDYSRLSLYHYLKQAADQYPEQTALIYNHEHVTYREMISNIDRLAAAYTAMGLKKGDRIALLTPNCPAYVYSFYGAVRQGLIVVQINPLLTSRELSFIVRDTKARALIVVDAMFPLIEEAMLEQDIENIIIAPLTGERISADVRYFEEILQQTRPNPPDVPINPEEDLAVLQYTSGTTGFPKGAMLTHANLVANAEMTREMLREWKERFTGEEILCIALMPFFDTYGLTCCLNAGLTIPSGQILVPFMDIDLVLELIQQYKPAILPGVPDLYLELFNHPEIEKYSLNSVKICISGDSPMPVEAIELFEEKTGSSILEGYGLAEASPITHCNPFIGVRKPGSIGVPYPGTDCKIVDLDTGERELPAGEEGELIIKGPQVMKGYWNLPNKTVRSLRNGWLYTGDIARMDEDGYFYIVDRKFNMINYAGYKIFPKEVEDVIHEHPQVAEAVCIGIREKHFGEVVKAFVVLKDRTAVTPEEIIDFCRARLVKYKVPRQVELRRELPKSVFGKILRHDLIVEEQRRRLLAD